MNQAKQTGSPSQPLQPSIPYYQSTTKRRGSVRQSYDVVVLWLAKTEAYAGGEGDILGVVEGVKGATRVPIALALVESTLQAKEGALLCLAAGLGEVHPPLGFHKAEQDQLDAQQCACPPLTNLSNEAMKSTVPAA